jgi:hypothetical protein
MLVVGTGIVMTALVIAHAPGVNGPLYWAWTWRRLGICSVYPLMGIAALPFFAGQYLYARDPARVRLPLALGMLSAAALMLTGVTRLGGIDRVVEIITNPDDVSYFTDAVRLVRGGEVDGLRWLSRYPDLMPSFHLHTLNKPPGPLLYYLQFVAVFGATRAAALVSGLVIVLLATLSIPAAYLLLRQLTGRATAAFHGASFLAFCPGYVLFFPELDLVFPLLTCALWATWAVATDGARLRVASAFGGILALVLFMSYSFLVLGPLLLGYAVLLVAERKVTVATLLRPAGIAFATFVAVNFLLYVAFGYDALAVFRQALRQQTMLLKLIPRPYPATVLFDLTDFALSTGWTGSLLAALFLFGRHRSQTDRALRRLAILCVGQLLLVAGTALLPGETARVWLFLVPLLLLPVGLELERWSPRARLLVYATTWLVTTAILQNMRFIA